MFSKDTQQSDVEFYLPQDEGYRVHQDNYNGRWLLSQRRRYIASFSWIKYGAQGSATLVCEAAWSDHALKTDETPPWIK